MESSLSLEIPAIKGYEQIRLIGSQGGMSQMYRAKRVGTGQEVIIKFMPAPFDEQEALKLQHRFAQEILIARLAANNHLLAAIDHGDIPMPGSDAPRLYLVYPYIEYGSLADLLTFERPWESWELPHITDIITQAAEGLFHLHKSGIVHQDVKPSNFLWMPTDTVRKPLRRIHVWLIDFGTAEPERSGKSREIKGTLKYLAPEQLHGEIKYSVDQYALALLARLLLTGHEPLLPNESDDLLQTRPTQLNLQRLSEPEIDQVLFRALAPHPQDRFPSVMEFAQALQTAILKQIQLNPRASHSVPPQSHSQLLPASSLLHPALSTREATPTALPIPGAPNASIVLPPLNPPKAYEPPRARDHAQPRIAARNKASGPSLPAVSAQKWLTVKLPDTLRMLAWSPSGTELACTFYNDLPQIISVKHSVETLASFPHAHAVCWSPDSRFLAMSIDNETHPQAEIRFCDRNAPKERQRALSFDQPEPVRGMDWSQRGLFAAWLNDKLLVHDFTNIASQKRLPAPGYTLPLEEDMHCDQLTTLRWSPNGEWLAAGSNNGQIVCWQPHTAQCLQQQPLKKNIRSISWSPDGRVLVVAFANKQVLFWNLHSGQATQAELPDPPRMVSISRQTGHIAVATEEALVFFEHAGAQAPTARHPGQLFAAFSPNNELATLDQHDGAELIIWQT